MFDFFFLKIEDCQWNQHVAIYRKKKGSNRNQENHKRGYQQNQKIGASIAKKSRHEKKICKYKEQSNIYITFQLFRSGKFRKAAKKGRTTKKISLRNLSNTNPKKHHSQNQIERDTKQRPINKR